MIYIQIWMEWVGIKSMIHNTIGLITRQWYTTIKPIVISITIGYNNTYHSYIIDIYIYPIYYLVSGVYKWFKFKFVIILINKNDRQNS